MIFDIYRQKIKNVELDLEKYKDKADKIRKELLIVKDYLYGLSFEELIKKHKKVTSEILYILHKNNVYFQYFSDTNLTNRSIYFLSLYYFLENRKDLSLSDIANILNLSLSSVYFYLTLLRKKGFVKISDIRNIDREKEFYIENIKIKTLKKKIKILHYKGLEIPVIKKFDFLRFINFTLKRYNDYVKSGVIPGAFIKINGKYYISIFELHLFLYCIWVGHPVLRNDPNSRFSRLLFEGYDYIKKCFNEGRLPLDIPVFILYKDSHSLMIDINKVLNDFGIINHEISERLFQVISQFSLEKILLGNRVFQSK
jgi:hypothetical protein